MDIQGSIQDEKTVTDEKEMISFFGGKFRIPQKSVGIFKVVLPLIFVGVCAFVMAILLNAKLEKGNNIDGRFVFFSNPESEYIQMDSNGGYELKRAGKKISGHWNLEGNSLTFTEKNGEYEGKLVERKYIFFYDESFLRGEVPEGDEFDAEVTSSDGTLYGFSKDGKVYTVIDGSNTEIGSYISDGWFIIVTTKDGNITYLKTGDGITSDFYQAE